MNEMYLSQIVQCCYLHLICTKIYKISRSEEFHLGDLLMLGYPLSGMGYQIGGMGYQIEGWGTR